MKVKYPVTEPGLQFSDLNSGDLFRFVDSKNAYIKAQSLSYGNVVNTICCSTGKLLFVEHQIKVAKLRGCLTVEGDM